MESGHKLGFVPSNGIWFYLLSSMVLYQLIKMRVATETLKNTSTDSLRRILWRARHEFVGILLANIWSPCAEVETG